MEQLLDKVKGTIYGQAIGDVLSFYDMTMILKLNTERNENEYFDNGKTSIR